MEDIRLKKEKMQLDGKVFELCVNFNVLADLQEKFGSIKVALNLPPLVAARSLLAAMMNEYADSKGWEKCDYTAREAGRFLPTEAEELNDVCAKLLGLLRDAVVAKAVPSDKAKDNAEKN